MSSTATAPQSAAASREPATKRLLSLDVFRGATIAAMVLVNNPGSGQYIYGPLRHAEWDGWTFTDLVFPFFLWIVGVAMTFSFSKRLEAGADRRRLLLHALQRSAILFALGLFLYGFPNFDFSTIRILGVLQRIAICSFLGAVLLLTAGVRGQIVAIVLLLSSYWLLMRFAPVPGYGAGHLDVERNFEHYIDGIVLKGHLYRGTKTWDPEGVVSTLPAIATVIFGILAGKLLRSARSAAEKTSWLFVMGNALIVAGLIMDVWLPINKKLWTSSFAVFMAGMASVALAMNYWLVDIQGWRRWAKPFAIFGVNAIVIYMFHELLDAVLSLTHAKPWLFEHVFRAVASPINASLLYAMSNVAACYVVAYAMYRRRWVVKF